MVFQLTEEQLAVKEAAREFAQNELKPGVIDRDRHMTYPTEQVRMMGELGFMGMMVSPEYGGSGMDTLSYVLAMEEISKVDSSCSVIMSVNNSLVCWGIETYGTEEQKEKYLPRLATGEWIGAFCLSEPEAGSDATSQRTTAVEMDDHYLLNGTKNWITNGGTSKLHLVIAQTHPEKGHRGINAFIVETDSPGVTVGAKEDKLGIRASDTHTIMYNDVKVPKENRIGDDGFGFKFAMKTLSGGRIGIASQALGIAGGQFGQVLGLLFFGAVGFEPPAYQGIVYRHDDRAGAVHFGDLLHSQYVGKRIHAAAPVFRGGHHAHEAQFRHFADFLFRVGPFGVALDHAGLEVFLGKFAGRFLYGQLLFG